MLFEKNVGYKIVQFIVMSGTSVVRRREEGKGDEESFMYPFRSPVGAGIKLKITRPGSANYWLRQGSAGFKLGIGTSVIIKH